MVLSALWGGGGWGRGGGEGNRYGYIDGYTASINDKGDTIWHKQ
jgi:hypothetical protein